MRVIPLGGAHEVGASSTIIEFGAHRVLVDAGIRLGEGDPLPDLDRLKDETGSIEAIYLTHAHIDHSGALPLVHMAYPDVPIYMTPATYSVVRTLLSDSLRLMEDRYEKEGEIPFFSPAAVESCLGCIRPVPFDYTVKSQSNGFSATFHPAGHILGASAITLNGRTGSLMITGDISVTDQRTVPGMFAPRQRPDVVMVESTYGDRLHAHRPTQEAQLIRTVAETIESGGKVIVPAFAVGRAQEVILILRHAMLEGLLPTFPVFVDGMVRDVCDVYTRFPSYLQGQLKKRVQKGEHPFFPAGGPVHRVKTQMHRQRILEGPACCIIASSGMMTGGPSAFYAAALAGGRKNLIAITGYQDEEAPGRALLDLVQAHPSKRFLKINDQKVKVACKVEKYSLSAHADSAEITGLLQTMNPTQGVVLVHGDGGARNSLATMLDSSIQGQIYMPNNGETLQFDGNTKLFYAPQHRKKRGPRIGAVEQPLDAYALPHLHQTLCAETGTRGLYRLVDLFERWYGPEAFATPEDLDALEKMIHDDGLYFQADRRRPHLFRLCSPERILSAKKKLQPKKEKVKLRLELNSALQKIAELFPADSGLYKKGARQDEQTLLLFFRFPRVAKAQYEEAFQTLQDLTGWKVEINDMPHHAALEEKVRRLLPESWNLLRNPAILHESETVRIQVSTSSQEKDGTLTSDMEVFQAHFLVQTGYRLEVKHIVPKEGPKTKASPQEKKLSPGEERMEINRSYQFIEEAFSESPNRPYKKSKKGNRIVLHFLSPTVGERYLSLISEIAADIGWEVAVHPQPNQYGIKQAVRAMIPEEWELQKDPGVLKREQIVRVKLGILPSENTLKDTAERVFLETGFHLEVDSL